MSDQWVRRIAARRRLWLGGLALALGLGRGERRARAADGDDILAGRVNVATSTTTLTDDSVVEYGFSVRQGLGDTAVQAIGGPSASAGKAGGGIEGVGGVKGPAAYGGWGVLAYGGGRIGDLASGGMGAVATGGESASGTGGSGAVAEGGRTTSGIAGDGLVARGVVIAPPALPGPAVRATGGTPAVAGSRGGVGILAEGGGQIGMQGTGLDGYTSSTLEAGVEGVNLGTGPGVIGVSIRQGPGVPPVPGSGVGVRGLSTGGPGGRFESDSGTGAGGSSNAGPGIEAFSQSGFGLTGTSQGGYGVVGTSTDGTGVVGVSTSGTGGYFQTGVLGQWAGYVNNNQAAGGDLGNGALGLLVSGDVVVENGTKPLAVDAGAGGAQAQAELARLSLGDTDTEAPSALAPRELRLLYCMESIISVFEDFGRARLANGRARVEIDPLFAETIDTSSYLVFVTPRSATAKPLAVVARDSRGFNVQEGGGGTGAYDFDYRVVAPRQGLTPPHPIRPILPAACSPRPQVSVQVARGTPGQLVVTVTATTSATTPTNWLTELRFGAPRPLDNAVVDVRGGPTDISTSQTVRLPTGTTTAIFTVRRVQAGRATTVPLEVVDSCGPWPTFVGGGPTAF